MSDKEINETTKEKPKTRKPGRPPLVKPQQPKLKNGIVQVPSDPQHHIEFLYDKPTIFRKIWHLFKQLHVEKVQLTFMKTQILIYCKDHHGKNSIRVKIDCKEVDHYYCKKELDIGLNCKNPELIMNTIDKKYSSILFLSNVNSIQKNIQIILKNQLLIEETHKIELIGVYDKNENDDEFLDNDYPIKFCLECKYFKKMINDINTFSTKVDLKKDGPDDYLMFEYVTSDKKIKSYHIIKDSKSINLQDTLKHDETFRTSFQIDVVKPIASALISDNINIYADEKKRIKFLIQMDPSVEVTILMPIIDNRDDKIN